MWQPCHHHGCNGSCLPASGISSRSHQLPPPRPRCLPAAPLLLPAARPPPPGACTTPAARCAQVGMMWDSPGRAGRLSAVCSSRSSEQAWGWQEGMHTRPHLLYTAASMALCRLWLAPASSSLQHTQRAPRCQCPHPRAGLPGTLPAPPPPLARNRLPPHPNRSRPIAHLCTACRWPLPAATASAKSSWSAPAVMRACTQSLCPRSQALTSA